MAGGTDGPPLHTRLLQKLKGDVSTDWLSRSIFKVPQHLRRISRQAYEPQVVSIGPYHHGKGQLKKMEAYKMLYLKKLLERSPEVSLEDYVTALKVKEKEAREFYSEPLKHISGEKFVEMMLLDGCFIIELIRESAMGEKDVPLTQFILSRAKLDLLLVENQLPFFILLQLFDMAGMSNDQAEEVRNWAYFMDLAINFFSEIMPGSPPGRGRPKNQEDIKHLLGLLHDCWTISPDCWEVCIRRTLGDPESLEEVRSLSPEVKLNICSIGVVRSSPPEISEEVRSPLLKEEEEEEEEVPSESKKWRFIRPAKQLSEAGIIFKKVEKGFFEIKFEEGVMSIPTLTINDNTESILRNLVAYEQCFKGASSKRFTDYIIFMDCLMNTGKDVELLSQHEVIDNCLGDDEVVATIFNKLSDSVLIFVDDFSYADIFIEVDKHCKIPWNQLKANLRSKYFNTPWAGISFFGGALLLLLNVIQNVFSALSYLFN